MIACGDGSTVAVTEDGELLAWGDGRLGQHGLGAVLHQQQPARVGVPELFANLRIRWPRPDAATWRWWRRTGQSKLRNRQITCHLSQRTKSLRW